MGLSTLEITTDTSTRTIKDVKEYDSTGDFLVVITEKTKYYFALRTITKFIDYKGQPSLKHL